MRFASVATLVTLLALGACVSACDVPLGAIRRSPPSGIDARVTSAGAAGASFTLAGTDGPFALADALTHDEVLLVFYRGHW